MWVRLLPELPRAVSVRDARVASNHQDRARLLDCLLMSDNPEKTMDPATTAMLITAIVTLVQQCRKDRNYTDDQLIEAARGAQGVLTIRRGLRAQGLRGRRFRSAVREAVVELKLMSDDDIREQILNAPEIEKDEDGNDGLVYDLF